MPRGAGARVLALSGTLPAISLAATLAVILHRLPLMVGWAQSSDSVGPMLVAETVGRIAHGARIQMASEGNLSIVGLDLLTRWLPDHRTVWLAFPFVLELLAVIVLAATVRALAGWRAAVICAAIAAATPPLVLTPLLSQAFHNTAFFLLVVTGTVLTWLARSDRPLAGRRLVACAVLGVVGGVELLSDHLYFVGVMAMVGAAVLLAWRRRDRQARDLVVAALATSGIVVVVWLIGSAWAVWANVHWGSQPLAPASLHRIRQNLSLLRAIVLAMVNGRGTAPGPLALRLLCAAAALAGLAVLLWTLVRAAMGRRPASATRVDDVPGQRATTAFASYWALVGSLLLAAFVFSQIPIDLAAVRYMPPVLWAVAAVVPLAVAGSWLRSVIAGTAVAIVGLYGAVVLTHASATDFGLPPDADVLASTLESLHVDHGYASYWQGDMLTWQSDGRVVSRAVFQRAGCGASEPGWFCPYTVNTVASWYAPTGAGPTFLIVDSPSLYLPSPLPPELKPRQVLHVDRFIVYVFDQDIGAAAAARTTGWWTGPGS